MRICLVVTMLIALVGKHAHAAAEAPRPNILYFYVDDMGWGSIGPNGQHERRAKNLPTVRTPNLDRLAAEGVNFRRGYGCTVCSPARSSLQSGFHQGHTFADRNDPDNAKKAMRADEVLIGDALSAAGYVTAYWGKWGYGGSKDQANPSIVNVQTLPTSHGYKYVLAELHHVRAHTFFQPTLWSAPARANALGGLELVPNSMSGYRNNEAWPSTPALQNHPDYPTTGYCDDAYAFAALDFVRTQGQNYNASGQPFFGIVGVQIPHAPFKEVATLPEWDKAYEDDPHFNSLADQSRQWAAMVTRIDAHFGNILAALEDPNHDGDTSDSIADNTLVLFQSDNGGPAGQNNVELDANGGLRANKGKIQEGGIRTPMVMRWTGTITANSPLKAGTSTDMVVDVTDMLPTFCELAGAPVPLGIDGVSIAPTLLGNGHQRPRDFVIHEAGNGQSIIRGRWKLVRSRREPLALYDLDVDHAEANDVAASQPELVKELEALMLGERVDEPRGFATTYHHWKGRDGSMTSDAKSWSDYAYSNAGITYMEDAGAPQPSWIATIANTGHESQTARVDADLEVLGLEIRGNSDSGAKQKLVVDAGTKVTGRNEIRVSSHGRLLLDGGSVSSLRWVDVQQGGKLTGHGLVDAAVYNSGAVTVGGRETVLKVNGDFRQSSKGKLSSTVGGGTASLQVTGHVSLNGLLELNEGSQPASDRGTRIPVLTGSQITGRFTNPHDEVVTADGSRFTITYSESAVSLLRKK